MGEVNAFPYIVDQSGFNGRIKYMMDKNFPFKKFLDVNRIEMKDSRKIIFFQKSLFEKKLLERDKYS
jgi:hypothetical protein